MAKKIEETKEKQDKMLQIKKRNEEKFSKVTYIYVI